MRDSVRRAVDNGVLLDVGHGQGSFDFDVAERAMAEGVVPHTISSDLHVYNLHGPVFDLVTTASKFLLLGLDLPDALRRCTASPAEVMGMKGEIGTLAPGAAGDPYGLTHRRDAVLRSWIPTGRSAAAIIRLVPARVIKAGREIPAVVRG